MIVISTYASAARVEDRIVIDRKFHDGVTALSDALGERVSCVFADLGATSGAESLDNLRLRTSDIPYDVVFAPYNSAYRLAQCDASSLSPTIARASLVYGMGSDIFAMARDRRIPYIPVVENTLINSMRIAWLSAGSPGRGIRRCAGALKLHRREAADLRGAYAVHCNGYAAYRYHRRRHPNTGFFIDSRVRRAEILPDRQVRDRIARYRSSRRIRLITSSRLEPIKGSGNLVALAEQLRRMQQDYQLDIYGDGSMRKGIEAELVRRQLTEQVKLHDPIPYPELTRRQSEADLFVNLNVQDDPSCTYLEAMGAGLPIIGFENRTWTPMSNDSKAGIAVPRQVGRLAAAITANRDPACLESMALAATSFAHRWCFEEQIAFRSESIRDARSRSPREGAP